MTAWTVTRRLPRAGPARARRRRPVRRLAHQHHRDVVADGVGLPTHRADDADLLEEEVALAGGADQDRLELVIDHRNASPGGSPGPTTTGRAPGETTRLSGGAPRPRPRSAPSPAASGRA